MFKLYYGNIEDDDINYSIEIRNVSVNQVLLYEFYILKKWLKKNIKQNCSMLYCDGFITINFNNKKDIAVLKISKISNRYFIKNI